MSNWKRRTAIGVAILFVTASGVFACRKQIERGIIAYRICRAGIFTPPTTTGESRWVRRWRDARFYWDFAALRIARERRLKQLNPELRPLIRELDRHLAAGENMQYSMHIYREIRWRLNFTPDVAATRARIDDLRQSLNQPEKQAHATQQQPDDGSWGMGIDPSVWSVGSAAGGAEGNDGEPGAPAPVLLGRIHPDWQLDTPASGTIMVGQQPRTTRTDETWRAFSSVTGNPITMKVLETTIRFKPKM